MGVAVSAGRRLRLRGVDIAASDGVAVAAGVAVGSSGGAVGGEVAVALVAGGVAVGRDRASSSSPMQAAGSRTTTARASTRRPVACRATMPASPARPSQLMRRPRCDASSGQNTPGPLRSTDGASPTALPVYCSSVRGRGVASSSPRGDSLSCARERVQSAKPTGSSDYCRLEQAQCVRRQRTVPAP